MNPSGSGLQDHPGGGASRTRLWHVASTTSTAGPRRAADTPRRTTRAWRSRSLPEASAHATWRRSNARGCDHCSPRTPAGARRTSPSTTAPTTPPAASSTRSTSVGPAAWRPAQPHYYRLHGPNVLIAYDDTQRHADHAHSVWRDPASDFGVDVLVEHRARTAR
ncbi:DUF3500 domain-containing protein [Streptomyces griseoruber]|uniref:DUF3500 domain-containing protein n=1 Tax=Streptomyces griseoruber TaxID=1943 RepID=UPI0037BA020B